MNWPLFVCVFVGVTTLGVGMFLRFQHEDAAWQSVGAFVMAISAGFLATLLGAALGVFG
jgi:hypothetical protein